MRIIVNKELVYPNVEALNDAGLFYEENDNSIIISLSDEEYRVAKNADSSLVTNSEDAQSLSYFIINKRQIVASGDLMMTNQSEYVCNSPLRLFSKLGKITTTEYVASGQILLDEKTSLNDSLIEASNPTKNKTL